jgi:glycosyltransferase involved in cell wall biosynthesis
MGDAGRDKLSILFTHYGDAWLRGSERILLDLTANLDRSRFMPIVWCNGGPVADELRRAGVPVYETDFASFFGYDGPSFSLPRYLSFVTTGLRLIRRHKVALIHCNGAAPHQWLLPVAWWSGLPLVAHLHAEYLRRERFVTFLHQATRIAGVSNCVLREFLADGVPPERCQVIHNGIDFGRLRPERDGSLRDRLGIGRGAIVIASLGSLVERKGMDLLIRALAGMREIEAHLLIGGEGPERGALAQLAQKLGVASRVHFLGYCADISPVYAAADIAALASRAESFGLALAEAGYFGLPVVSHRLPGISEVVLDGKTGLLVPMEDVAAMTAALRHLSTDHIERTRLGEAARSHVRNQFSLRRMVAEFESLYGALVDETRDGKDRARLRPYLRLLPGYRRISGAPPLAAG